VTDGAIGPRPMASLTRRLGEFHDRLTRAGFALAAILVGAIAASFCYEVVVRYFFGAPTAWTYDVGCYFLAAVIFLSVPEMARRNAHIHVNLLPERLSPTAARRLEIAIGLLATGACLTAAWITGSETWRQYDQGVSTISALPIPKWWVSIFIPYGMLSAALYFLRHLGAGAHQTLPIGSPP
jgi:TRAP-type C4-dicarboxylate transport system permease small subunit